MSNLQPNWVKICGTLTAPSISTLPAGAQPTLHATRSIASLQIVVLQVVAGSIGPMTTNGVTQSFSYSLTGVDPLCANGAGEAGNSCGVHIHVGSSCASDAGGHYYTGIVTSDPWTNVGYTSTAGGAAQGTAIVTTGGIGSDVEGRAFVVHNHAGARIGCAIISSLPSSPALVATDFIPYLNYNGNLASPFTPPPTTHHPPSTLHLTPYTTTYLYHPPPSPLTPPPGTSPTHHPPTFHTPT